MQNTHWAACTGVLGKREVGIVEREFLDVLNWDLRISEENILAHYDGVSDPGTRSPSYRRVASSSPNADRAAHRTRRHRRRKRNPSYPTLDKGA